MESYIRRGVGLTILILAVNAFVSYRATRTLINNDQWVRHTYQVLTELEATFSTLKDAESGERGFIIAGSPAYLQQYESAVAQINSHFAKLTQLTADNSGQQSRVPLLRAKIDARLDSLKEAVDMRRSGDLSGASQLIASGIGGQLMDAVRVVINEMETEENQLLQSRIAESHESQTNLIATFILANVVAGVILLVTATFTMRALRARKRGEERLRQAAAERTRLLAEAEAARATAESASRAKDEFLAVLSHELRTPLTSVFGWVQLLQNRTVDTATRDKALKVIDRNIRAQTQIIDDLLNISQIITGKLQIRREMTDALQIVKTAIETSQPSAEAKHIHLRLDHDDDLPAVYVDPARLQQIIWNLLSNAVKFTPKDGEVFVRVHRVDSDLQIVVHDTGQGIAPEFLSQVFNRFSQADTSSTRTHGGLGIGLALVRQLVELHGGSVRAESQGPGKGSTFAVSFPVAGVKVETSSSIHTKAGVDSLKGLRVMLVEDEPDTREMIAEMLQQFGASVTQAASASEALRLLVSAAQPNILISDIGMPDMDGYELLAAVQAQSKEVPPAIALTAFASIGDKQRALMAGFQAHLNKPVEMTTLVTTVADLAKRRAS
jgi:signal transduction histidine kinase